MKNAVTNIKVILITLLAALCSLFALGLTVGVNNTALADNEPSMTLRISEEYAKAGETVDVKIYLVDNPGVASLQLDLSYEDILTLDNVAFNGNMGGQSMASDYKNNGSPVTLIWVNGFDDYTEDCIFATLTFTIADNAEDYAYSMITADLDPENTYNSDETNINVNLINGFVCVQPLIAGDINGDGNVNNKDITRLFRYIAHWDVGVEEAALDVNGDGSVNNKDITRLFRYIAHWDVDVFLRSPLTVTFNGNGGTLVSGKTEQIVKYGGAALAPVFEKSGYEFDGFDVDFTHVTANITVTANWITSVHIHDYSETVFSPSCTEKGYTVHSCNGCDDSYIDTYVDELGHNYGAYVQTTAPTCTSTGVETATCSRCGNTTTRNISATGHTAATAVEENRTEATCTANGSYDSVVYCSVCNAEISRTSNQITMLGHNYGAYVQTTAPTCTSTGVETATCSRCGNTKTRDIPALGGHDYVDGVCTVCGDSYFIFTLLNNDTYEIKRNGSKTLPTLIVIPSTYNGKEVTSIGNYAFSSCSSLTSVTIPNSVTSIGGSAFSGCSSLTSLTIPDSVTSIGGSAFRNCTGLTNITIPDSVTSIGNYAFAPNQSFGSMNLKTVTIGNSVTSIGDYAFYLCTSLTNITFNQNSKLQNIGNYAFSSCYSLTNITIPDGVTSIGDSAFRNCYPLYYIVNKSNLQLSFDSTNNGQVAYYAKAIEDKDGNVTYKDNPIFIENDFMFEYASNEYRLIAYMGNEDTITLPLTYDGNPYTINCWQSKVNIIIPQGLTRIEDYAFYCCVLANITISNSVTNIGSWAFAYCNNLTNITFSGTIAQWNAISKGANWKDDVPATVVHCTNGDVAI